MPQFPDLENGDNKQGHWLDAKCLECNELSVTTALIQVIRIDSTQLLWGTSPPPLELRKVSRSLVVGSLSES